MIPESNSGINIETVIEEQNAWTERTNYSNMYNNINNKFINHVIEDGIGMNNLCLNAHQSTIPFFIDLISNSKQNADNYTYFTNDNSIESEKYNDYIDELSFNS